MTQQCHTGNHEACWLELSCQCDCHDDTDTDTDSPEYQRFIRALRG